MLKQAILELSKILMGDFHYKSTPSIREKKNKRKINMLIKLKCC